MAEVLALLERIDERTMALKEGVDRQGDLIEDQEGRIRDLESTKEAYLSNGEAGLRRIVREEHDRQEAEQGVKWINVLTLVAAAVGLLLSLAVARHWFGL